MCEHACVLECVCVYMCVCVCMHMCVHACMCVCMSVWVRACVRLCEAGQPGGQGTSPVIKVQVVSVSKKLSLPSGLDGKLVAWCQLGKQPTSSNINGYLE